MLLLHLQTFVCPLRIKDALVIYVKYILKFKIIKSTLKPIFFFKWTCSEKNGICYCQFVIGWREGLNEIDLTAVVT